MAAVPSFVRASKAKTSAENEITCVKRKKQYSTTRRARMLVRECHHHDPNTSNGKVQNMLTRSDPKEKQMLITNQKKQNKHCTEKTRSKRHLQNSKEHTNADNAKRYAYKLPRTGCYTATNLFLKKSNNRNIIN